ncbi:MAG: FkbM family methyltransferase [Burkholderiaceae bacterium]|jgi:FkbM family methyltransferase|nr:FkbM family methyltransferase [Burkholderiaceae bacterium]
MLTTAHKIELARAVARPLIGLRRLVGKSSHVTVTRRGIRWCLNLNEGIDFSIYLMGGFELSTLKLYARFVRPGATVVDIGANIGAHALPLASMVGSMGSVIAFEPTAFAVSKLRVNASLNPVLSSRLVVCQYMLVARAEDPLEREIYSSWPLSEQGETHEKHKGRLQSTDGAQTRTLDHALADMHVGKIDFIKIDVDGNEYSVLRGGASVLERHRPRILMELAPYLFASKPEEFEKLIGMLQGIEYRMSDAATGKMLPMDAVSLRQTIREGASRNVLIEPS